MSVALEGETVIVASSFNSNGGAYHTRECACVRRMKSPRRVDRSVAEWKDLSECSRCQRNAE